MPSPIFTGLTGHGKAPINGGTAITVLAVSPLVTTLGAVASAEGYGSVQRLFRAGWIGVGFDAGGSPPDLLYWSTFLEYPFFVYQLQAVPIYADTYFWDLFGATTINLEVDW